MKPIITLTTDFGYKDNFVGVMKGVMLKINPDAVLVDLTHDIPLFDPEAAGFCLQTAHRFFPENTVHLAVVDPGVGSDRSILMVRAWDQFFIAPNNGLLSQVLDTAVDYEVRLVENKEFRLDNVSRTFHGRDIMAPAAAHLSLGIEPSRIGPVTDRIVRTSDSAPEIKPGLIKGKVIYVDRFGNLITNITALHISEIKRLHTTIRVGNFVINGFSRAYSEHDPGILMALMGSSGRLEIARYQARAESPPDLTLNSEIFIEWNPNAVS